MADTPDVRPVGDLPYSIGKTAARELANNGITTLHQVAGHTRTELLAIHGVGHKGSPTGTSPRRSRGGGRPRVALIGDGAALGLVVGVGYALTAAAVTAIYDQKPQPLTYLWINGVFTVAGLTVAGAILGAFA